MGGPRIQSWPLPAGRCRRAISLVELLAVATLLGVIALVAVPAGVSAAALRAEEATGRIQADLAYAQSLAILLRKPHSLVCDTDQGFYYLAAAQTPGTPITEPVRHKPYRVHFLKSFDSAVLRATPCLEAYADVALDSADFNGSTVLTFSALGEPLGAGGVPLVSGRIEILVGTRRLAVVIDATTGAASLQEPI